MSFESDLIWVHAAINVQYAFNLLSYLNIYMHAYAHPHPHFHDPHQRHAGHIHPYLSTDFLIKKKLFF
jgi:hydrogenase/urease accessory protein HupE